MNTGYKFFDACFLILFSLLILSGCSFLEKTNQSKNTDNTDYVGLENHYEEADAVDKSITLYQAIARGLKYNIAYHQRQADNVAHLDRLDASNYMSLKQLLQSANKKNIQSAALESQCINEDDDSSCKIANDLSLDTVLVLNCKNSKPVMKEYVIAWHQQREIVHEFVESIRYAYWRLVAAQRLQRSVAQLVNEINIALGYVNGIYSKNVKPPLEALEYQRDLWKIMQTLSAAQVDHVSAKSDLALLMGMNINTKFTVSEQRRYGLSDAKKIIAGIKRVSQHTQIMNPELNIQQCLANKASYLSAKKQMSADISQSILRYQQSNKHLNAIANVIAFNNDILQRLDLSSIKRLSEQLSLIRYKESKLLSQLDYDLTYAKGQTSIGNLLGAIGYDPLASIDHRLGLDELEKMTERYQKIAYFPNGQKVIFEK